MYMAQIKRAIQISKIIFILALIIAVIPTVNAKDQVDEDAIFCCPPPDFVFPAYLVCPFNCDLAEQYLKYEDLLNQFGYVNVSCSTCSGSKSTVTSFSYSNTPLIIPEKDSLITAYDDISVSFALKSKEQIMAKYSI